MSQHSSEVSLEHALGNVKAIFSIFTVSVFVFIFVAYQTSVTSTVEVPLPYATIGILYILGATLLAIGSKAFSTIPRIAANCIAAKSQIKPFQGFLRATLFALTITECGALMGFVASMITKDFLWSFGYSVIAAVIYSKYWPTEELLRRFVIERGEES